MLTRRLTTLLGAVLLSLAAVPAAAQDVPNIFPVVASSELAQGPNRFLFSLIDETRQPLAAPDVEVRLEFYDLDVDPEAVAFGSESRFLWAVEDLSGMYASDVDFPNAGRWGTRFYITFPDGRTEMVPPVDYPPASYDVWETTGTPPIGSVAPIVNSPTSAEVGGDLSLISTDPEPVERFYELSILEAVQADAPAVISFVTPAFCQSATCGPTLEKVKAVAEVHPEVNFVHVEPYRMHVQNDSLQPMLSEEGQLQAAPWTIVYGLRTEPYVVVLDADGVVRAKFEGAITVDELEDALAGL
jgi:hypothetical protein